MGVIDKKLIPGYRRVAALGSRVHTILGSEKCLYVHAGRGLYRIPRETDDIIKKPRPIAYLKDRASVGISLGDRVIISDGEQILAVDRSGNIRFLSSDPTLASCRAMAVWDGRLFLGGFDVSADLIRFSAPLRGGLPERLNEGEIWLDGILGIEKMRSDTALCAIGQGGEMAVYGHDGIYTAAMKGKPNDTNQIPFRDLHIEFMEENLLITDEGGEKYLALGIAGYEGERRVYNYAPEAKEGYRVHKMANHPCRARVMSLMDEGGEMIYFSVEGGKKYALYPTEIMDGGKPLRATAQLAERDRIWIGNEGGGLFLLGEPESLFDRHLPTIIKI